LSIKALIVDSSLKTLYNLQTLLHIMLWYSQVLFSLLFTI